MLLCTGSKQFKLSHGELQKHQNSLLATLTSSVPCAKKQKVTLASSADTTSASASGAYQSSTVVALDELDLPICKIPIEKAAEWVVMCYKDDNIHPSALESLLNSCSPVVPSKATDQLDKTIHTELSQLLDFFNLPGPVTKWLPPVHTLTLSQSHLLAFTYTCYQLERAKRAVEDMLSYKPHESEDQPAHVAMFVILRDRSNTAPMAHLAVRALTAMSNTLVSWVLRRSPKLDATGPPVPKEKHAVGRAPAGGLDFGRCHDIFDDGRYDYMDSVGTKLVSEHPKPTKATEGANANQSFGQVYGSMTLIEMNWCHRYGRVIGPADLELGQALQDALSSSVHGTRLSWGFAHVLMQDAYVSAEIPVWVLTW